MSANPRTRRRTITPWRFAVLLWLVWPITAEDDFFVKKFLWLSDIHMDPYYGTLDAAGQPGANCFTSTAPSLGQKGCDAPLQLVQETLQQAALQKAEFVILTGDMCRHGTDRLNHPRAETQAILSNVSQLLRETLGNVSIIPSLGNNDVTPDYFLDPQNPTEMLSMVTTGFDNLFETELERETFVKGGYLARNISDSLTVISLNTILYSTSHLPIEDDWEADPLEQFQWFESQLTLACGNDRLVYVVGHIPPTMGSYRHSQLWQTRYLKAYYSILQRTAPCVSGQLFGHLHADEFRWIDVPQDKDLSELHYPIWLASSVTPVYGSNPSYRWVSYRSDTTEILDYDTYYLNLLDNELEWNQGPSFRESFKVENLNFNSIQDLVHELNHTMLETNSSIWRELLYRQHVFFSEDTGCEDVPCRRAWICTLTTITSDDYASCLEAAGANPLEVAWMRRPFQERVKMGASLTLIILLVIVVVCLCRCGPVYLRRRHYQQHISQHDQNADGIFLQEDKQSVSRSTTTTTTTTPGASSSSLEEDSML